MSDDWQAGKRVAVIGAGPGGISTALALAAKGFHVRIYEKRPRAEALGGGVLLSIPVLAILRSYGMNLDGIGAPCVTSFYNHKGRRRVKLPHNPAVEEAMGIKGWHYGMLRSAVFSKMLELVPAGMIVPGHALQRYEDDNSHVRLFFENGATVQADIVVGADGIRSAVSKQAFGDHGLFHVGLRVWLAWVHDIGNISLDEGVIVHSRSHQASYFPMMHEGKIGFEWWVVEATKEGAPAPADPRSHLRALLEDWAGPHLRLLDATDFSHQIFRWDVYNRPSLQKWSKGRAVCVGDAVHPVSPYAAYGMGMAIEDGYFLAKFLQGCDLGQLGSLQQAFGLYEKQRVAYVNQQVEFARKLGSLFHRLPMPVAVLRDFVLDRTGYLGRALAKQSLELSQRETLALRELHVRPSSLS